MSRSICCVQAPGFESVVEGSAYSVGLCFSDARRLGEPMVWLKAAHGPHFVGLETRIPWELAEVDHAEGR